MKKTIILLVGFMLGFLFEKVINNPVPEEIPTYQTYQVSNHQPDCDILLDRLILCKEEMITELEYLLAAQEDLSSLSWYDTYLILYEIFMQDAYLARNYEPLKRDEFQDLLLGY
jgi:hypothetical protein